MNQQSIRATGLVIALVATLAAATATHGQDEAQGNGASVGGLPTDKLAVSGAMAAAFILASTDSDDSAGASEEDVAENLADMINNKQDDLGVLAASMVPDDAITGSWQIPGAADLPEPRPFVPTRPDFGFDNIVHISEASPAVNHDSPPPSMPQPTGKPLGYYFDNEIYTNFGTPARGRYVGTVDITTASQRQISGTSSFTLDIGQSFSVSGRFDFGALGAITLRQQATNYPVGFHYDNQSFLGGTITSTDQYAGILYGPNAEEYGGDFIFTIAGGVDQGQASGSFIAKH